MAVPLAAHSMIMQITDPESWLNDFIQRGLQEDIGSGDVTSMACIPSDSRKRARLLVKDTGVLAGVAVAERVFRTIDPSVEFIRHLDDGADVKPGDIAFEVEAHARALLMGERLVLNTMQRMSGIATESRRYRQAIADLPVRLLDTRKTTPLLRFLEKWAVRIGGCDNYRDGLFDWFMIKDNHIDACGGIVQAIERVAAYQAEQGLNLNVTVEVRSLDELELVLATGKVTRIMFDNFNTEMLREGVIRVNGRFETEASGGITLERLREVAMTGVDFISVGALTHSFRSLDLSLKMVK